MITSMTKLHILEFFITHPVWQPSLLCYTPRIFMDSLDSRFQCRKERITAVI